MLRVRSAPIRSKTHPLRISKTLPSFHELVRFRKKILIFVQSPFLDTLRMFALSERIAETDERR
jgi:hypothetical protein